MDGGDQSGVPATDDRILPQQSASIVVPIDSSTNRFVFVDGLRGFAALAIVVFHIWWYEPEPYPAFEYSHWLVDATFRRVRLAVQILLVVSGFVVAFTLRKTWVSPREIFWFLGRRFVRLMPPYWVTIGVIILVDILCQRMWGLTPPFDGPLSVHRLSAHLTLTQDILGHEALSAGIWTICIEMQFYVVAILGWGLAQRLDRRPEANDPRPSVWGLLAVFVPAALVSLFYWRPLDSTTPWVIHFLWMFFLGMVTWWALDQTVPTILFWFVIAIGLAELPFNPDVRYPNVVALTTASLIYMAGHAGRMQSWLNWRWLQYVGKISYSLYLIHFPVCHLVTSAAWKWCDYAPTPVQADLILLGALLASLLAAHVLFVLVEGPSNRVAAWMKRASETPVTPTASGTSGLGQARFDSISNTESDTSS